MTKKIFSAAAAWTIVWAAVAVERSLSKSDIWTILEASSIQFLQTSVTAYVFIALYDRSKIIHESIAIKSAVMTFLWCVSWMLNYRLQENIWWSVTESIIMFSSSVLWLIAHEYDIPNKVFQKINKTSSNTINPKLWK